jgi:hypothetical protein
LRGLLDLATASLSFVILPLGLVIIAFIVEKLAVTAWRRKATPGAQFVGRTMLFGLAITAALIIVSGATEVRSRWLLPLLFLLPAYAAMRAEEFGPKGRKIQHFLTGTGAVLAILALPAILYVQASGGNGLSSSTRLDYPAFYKRLTADGPVSTIIGDRQWVGNFRLVERDLVILDPQTPYFGSLMRPPAVAVWLDGGAPPNGLMNKLKKAGYVIDGDVRILSVPERLGRNASREAGFVRLRKDGKTEATDADIPDSGATDGD